MKKILLPLLLIACTSYTFAQKVYTKNGSISFFSKTEMEDIKAENNQVMSVLNLQTGELQFSLLVKNFHFPKALMEEHFNENYLESEKYPKSSFKGTIADIGKVKLSADGTYPVTVTGDLTIHNVTNKVSTKGTLTVKGGKVTGHCVFIAALADYKVEIPKLVEKNISKTIEITVHCLYDQQL